MPHDRIVEGLLDGTLQLGVALLLHRLTRPKRKRGHVFWAVYPEAFGGGEDRPWLPPDMDEASIYSAHLQYCADEAAEAGLNDDPPPTPPGSSNCVVYPALVTCVGNKAPSRGGRCFIYTGLVSYVGNESGLVDENRFFERRDGPADLKEGERVTVLAYVAGDTRVRQWRILRVYRPPGDRGPAQAPLPHTVTARNRRHVTLDGGAITFHLDRVSTQFTPRVADVVLLTTLADGSVDGVRWADYRTLMTRVVAWDEDRGEGTMETDNIAFHRDACTPGYKPRVGDQVTADAICTVGGWRALCVVHANSPKGGDPPGVHCTPAEILALCRPKKGISFSARTFDFGKVGLGKTVGPLVVTMRNDGRCAHTVVNINTHMAHRFHQVAPKDLDSFSGRTIKPGETLQVAFECSGRFLGHSREVPVFFFRNFAIGFTLEMEVVHPDASQMETASSSNLRAPRFYHGLSIERNQHILSGERPIQPPKFIECRLGQYNVPDRYWEAFLNNNNESRATPEIQKEIEEITPCLRKYLEFDSFADRLHALLYLEEVDAMLKLRRYKMERVTFVVEDEYLKLNVPGLAEKRPALLVGDIVLASAPWREGEGLVYEAFVHRTYETHILLRFNPEFHETAEERDYNVEFKLGRTAYRRQHAAIDVAMTHLGEVLLFPSRLELQPPQVRFTEGLGGLYHTPAGEGTPRPVKWLNSTLDAYQRAAIRNALEGVARPLPYVIFGPPGTGKTMTLVELVLKIFFLLPESRVLIATPSNSSANLMAERLIGSGQVKPGDLVRLVGYHVYEDGNLPASLMAYCTTGNIKMTAGEEAEAAPVGTLGMSSNKSTLGRHRIVIGTCIALGQLFTMGLPHGSFSHVLVDEAAQATEPEIMVALDFLKYKGGQIILAGDPMQLGPVVSSNLANQYGLGESYLDRLLHRFPYQADRISYPDTEGYDPRLVSFLLNNYRTLPEILTLPNDLFYESKLVPQVSNVSGPEVDMLRKCSWFLPVRLGPTAFSTPAIVFHGVRGTDFQETESPSWFNPQEALVVLQYLQSLYKSGVAAQDIGVITPYRKQVQKMRWFYNRRLKEVPKIGSVEEFQGQEKKVVIVSVVRSSSNPKILESDIVHSLGFVSSPQRLNVALTRSQTLLIIVGNPHVLSKDPYWKATLKYCIDINAYWGCDLPLEFMASVAPYLS